MNQERTRLFRWAKKMLSPFLGCLMRTFGLLKVVDPTIDGWFTVQIQQSHLSHSAILMGKIGEINKRWGHQPSAVRPSPSIPPRCPDRGLAAVLSCRAERRRGANIA